MRGEGLLQRRRRQPLSEGGKLTSKTDIRISTRINYYINMHMDLQVQKQETRPIPLHRRVRRGKYPEIVHKRYGGFVQDID